MADNNLKPCPFCGGEAYIESGIDWHWIKCDLCEAETQAFKTEKEAIESWNTRKPMERIVEQLDRKTCGVDPEFSECSAVYLGAMFEAIDIVKAGGVNE